jgi:hypothetical protein
MTTVDTMFWIICFLIVATVTGGAVAYKQHANRERRLRNLKTVTETVAAIAQDDETARKVAIMARIAKVGILQCDATNLKLR